MKPRLAIVSSYNVCCGIAYYAAALKDLLKDSFDVEVLDLKTHQFLRQEGKSFHKISEDHINDLCQKVKEFDLVNVHLELGLYGIIPNLNTERLLKVCQAAGRLILTVHAIDYKGTSGLAHLYRYILDTLKKRPSSNPFHLITHLSQEKMLLKKHFSLDNVTDFPLIYLTNERRKQFQQKRNPTEWKKQFGLKETDLTIGVFGLLNYCKNYTLALKTLNLLPSNYKLLIIGEAHHTNIREWKIDPTLQEILSYLDHNIPLSERVIFTGKRDDANYYEDLANVDYVLLPSFEVGQTGSATFSNALELACPTLKANTFNSREYEVYFPNCFEVFDIGNYYEAKNKILNFDKNKLENLKKRADLFSEVQLQKVYRDIYEPMKVCTPISLSDPIKVPNEPFSLTGNKAVKAIYKCMPGPVRSFLKKVKTSLGAPAKA
jgi:hypothetical protein